MRQPVKYPAVFGLLVLCWATRAPGQGQAQQPQYRTFPGPLLGGAWGPPPEPPLAPIDPSLPKGARFSPNRARPDLPARSRACSPRRPVCVHRAPGVDGRTARRALAALEGAYERLVLVTGLPAPLGDRGLGGNDALDLYLAGGSAPRLESAHDATSYGEHDEVSAFCILDGASLALLDRSASLCVGEAIGWRLDASESPHTRRAIATHWWHLAGWPTSVDAAVVDDVQANPQLGIGGREVSGYSEGTSLFYSWLEERFGASEPGTLAAALLSVSGGQTPPGELEWNNEPDVFDVLRHTFGGRARRFADMYADFVVDRAFFGARDDGTHLPAVEWTGWFGRVRFDWVVKFSSLPRNLAPARPIEPLGATYIWVDLDEVSLGSGLGFRAEWESPVAFKWRLVAVAQSGEILSTVDIPFQERGTGVEGRVIDVSAAAGVLVVGTNLGGTTLAHPFDPDMEPFEPHEFSVLLAGI